jgi:hypothetical protein
MRAQTVLDARRVDASGFRCQAARVPRAPRIRAPNRRRDRGQFPRPNLASAREGTDARSDVNGEPADDPTTQFDLAGYVTQLAPQVRALGPPPRWHGRNEWRARGRQRWRGARRRSA